MDATLLRIAKRVVWWEHPETTLGREGAFLCRVMALGTLDDVNIVESIYGVERLRRALEAAAPGILDARSWHYWHHRLGLGCPGPLPTRAFR